MDRELPVSRVLDKLAKVVATQAQQIAVLEVVKEDLEEQITKLRVQLLTSDPTPASPVTVSPG
jgi:cell division protein FtsB